MKYWMIGIVIAVLGLGEYAFVGYYPLSPQQRTQKFQKLPVVRSFVKAADLREIRRAIEESDSGFVSVYRGGKYRKWDDAEVLYTDFEEQDREAHEMVYRIRNIESIAQRAEETRRKAEEGDLSAMFQLYMMGKSQTGEKDVEKAVELLEAHESATAKLYLYTFLRKSVQLNSREGMLLHARVMQENYRASWQDDAVFAQVTLRNEKGLAKLRKAAADGDADAVWVVEELAAGKPAFRMP